MKILLVSDHYPPFIGGAHRQVHLLASLLAERGHEVDVATVWHKNVEPASAPGVRTHRIRQLRTALPSLVLSERQRHQPPYPDPVSVVQLRRLIADRRPDIVHSYGWISFACAAALLGDETPLMISVRDYGYACATRTLVHQGGSCSGPAFAKCVRCAADYYHPTKGLLAATGVLLSRPLLRRKVAAIHSISHFVQEMVHRDVAPSTAWLASVQEFVLPSFGPDLEVLDTGDDLDLWLDRLPDEPFMLFVGAFRRAKGLQTLFDAYARLDDPPPLVLIGTRERDSPPIPASVIALERFPHRAVMAAWDRALFGVFPSLWPEPLGSVVYEAMSRGRAVIGTSPGGQTDMISDGESGYLVARGDPAALAERMDLLVRNPSLCERLGENGMKRSRAFHTDRVMPEFEVAYAAVLAKHRSSTS